MAPTTVPITPMIVPCSRKISMMLRAEAPMVFRIAMSRVFSITSRISEATMLSAATITISPMPMPMPIFSSISAEYSSWLMSVQSWVR